MLCTPRAEAAKLAYPLRPEQAVDVARGVLYRGIGEERGGAAFLSFREIQRHVSCGGGERRGVALLFAVIVALGYRID